MHRTSYTGLDTRKHVIPESIGNLKESALYILICTSDLQKETSSLFGQMEPKKFGQVEQKISFLTA